MMQQMNLKKKERKMSSNQKIVNRPTENKALAIIAKEAMRLGITQAELMRRVRKGEFHLSRFCMCAYCRRNRLILDVPASEVFA